MNALVLAALCCTVAPVSDRSLEPTTLARDLRACTADDPAACGRLDSELEQFFAGNNDADRAVARRLAAAAVQLVRG